MKAHAAQKKLNENSVDGLGPEPKKQKRLRMEVVDGMGLDGISDAGNLLLTP
jgi:hypothetical protein